MQNVSVNDKIFEGVDANVYLAPSVDFINPTSIFYRLYTSSLISNFGGFVKTPNNFGSLYGLSREYDKDVDGNDANQNLFCDDFSKQDYANNITTRASVKFELKQSTIIPLLDKLKTAWSVEALQDYIKLCKASHDDDNVENIIMKELMNEIILQSDYRCMTIAKKKATKVSSTIRNDAFAYYDIIQEIQKVAFISDANLFAQTSVSVFVSPSVAMGLMSHTDYIPFKTSTGQKMEHCVYFKGSIKNINIFVDLFGFFKDDKYALVGVKDNERIDNASLVKIMRKFSILDAYDKECSESYFIVSFQYGLAFNPSDNLSEKNEDDSKLLHYIKFN